MSNIKKQMPGKGVGGKHRVVKPSRRRTAVWRAANPADSRFRMTNFPFHWINRVSARYYLDLEVALKSAGLDVPRWRVLIILSEIGPASVSQIAGHAVIKLSTMTKMLQRMEADELISLRASTMDARVTEADLTPAGRKAAATVRAEGQRVFSQAFAGISDGEIEALVALLQRVFANLDGTAGET